MTDSSLSPHSTIQDDINVQYYNSKDRVWSHILWSLQGCCIANLSYHSSSFLTSISWLTFWVGSHCYSKSWQAQANVEALCVRTFWNIFVCTSPFHSNWLQSFACCTLHQLLCNSRLRYTLLNVCTHLQTILSQKIHYERCLRSSLV